MTDKETKQEVIDSLKEQKTFRVTWIDRVEKEMEVEASSEEEVEKLFNSGELDFSKEIENSIDLEEGSLEIEEW